MLYNRLILSTAVIFAASPGLSQTHYLLNSTQVGAQYRPSIAFADLPRPTAYPQVRYVAPWGNDAYNGSASTPWKTIGKAFRTLVAGEMAIVRGGTYYEHVSTSNLGYADRPIRVVAATGERVVLAGPIGGTPFVKITQPYWVIEGLEVDATGSPAQWQPAFYVHNTHHVVLRRVVAHHGSGSYAVGFNGVKDGAIIDSRVYEFWYTQNGSIQDSMGVMVMPDSERILVQNLDSWGHSGDSVHCAGPVELGFGTAMPAHITIEGSRLGNKHKDGTLRRRDYENAIDIKSCQSVTIRDNKMFGYRPVSTAPGGTALVLHLRADRVLVEGNRFWDNGLAGSFGSPINTGLGSVVFRRNLIFDSVTESGSVGGGLRAGPAREIEIYDNTLYNVPAYGIRLGDDGTIGRSVIMNNIFEQVGKAIDVNLPNAPGLHSDRNLFWNAGLATDWRTRGFEKTSYFQNPMFVTNPRYNDFYTQPTSPARNTAIHTTIPFCGAGPDIGFLESDCN